jgi:GNAT superfamily N-acetyltransferase
MIGYFTNKNDLNSLKECLKECFFIEVYNFDIDECIKNNIRFLCYFKDNKVISTIMVTTKYNPVRNTKSYYLDYVSTINEERRKGYSKKLLEYLEKDAKENGISMICFESNSERVAAHKLYESMNYLIKDTDVFEKVIE